MESKEIPQLYKRYFVDNSDERRMMFEKLAKLFNLQKGIYPGSFVHITPSFYISDMTYIDADKRISRFFGNDDLLRYVKSEKKYLEDPHIKSFQSDYKSSLPVEEESFDIMFSFYAGFISRFCKKYLKDKGILVCNNSHGDASLAAIDKDYTLIGVIKRNGENFSISDKNLNDYLLKRDGTVIDENKVLKKMIGESFSKKAFAYIFIYRA